MPRCNCISLRALLCLCLACTVSFVLKAQTDTSSNSLLSVISLDSKAINGLSKQYSSLQSKLEKQSVKLLYKMQAIEDKFKNKLQQKDSTKANEVFTSDVKDKYQDLQNNLSDKTTTLKKFPLKEYIPGLDSMQTSLSFLVKNKALPADKLQELNGLSEKLKSLQSQLQKANNIQSFIREREASLKEQLLNSGLTKQLTGINKQVYYYQQQLTEYKALLNDKQKLKDKILSTIRSLPAFQKFWQKNSYLATLFPSPGSNNLTQALTGLQTTAGVQSLIAQRMGAFTGAANNPAASTSQGTSINPQQFLQQQVGTAQAQLSGLKDKLGKLGSGNSNSDMTMPDFKPNDQKTKSFLKRLVYGFNIQSEPSHYFLPATSDLALTLGYRLSDTKRAGIGLSYKMGWGKGLQSGLKGIRLSSEGIGLRSYVDIKSPIKSKSQLLNGLWISGGFEYNYLSSFRSLQELHNNIDVWQRSALMGISKKYKVGKKEGNMQLLYDFLHNKQTPPGTALKFRVGYNF